MLVLLELEQTPEGLELEPMLQLAALGIASMPLSLDMFSPEGQDWRPSEGGGRVLE